MKLEKLNPHLGARISGVNLEEFTPNDRGELRALMEEHQVLFFTGQKLDPRAFRRFGQVVGELQAPEDAGPTLETMEEDIREVHYTDVGNAPRGTFTDVWHSDMSCFECPSYGIVLQPVVLPSIGGDTIWASMYAAYEGLPDSLRSVVDEFYGLHQVCSAEMSVQTTHPIVRVNPATGRRGLYVNRLFTKGIVGMPPIQSANLLEMLLQHCTQPEFQMRISWSPDIVALWDNRFTLHYAVRDYSEPRRMIRVGLVGDRPIGPREYAEQRRAA